MAEQPAFIVRPGTMETHRGPLGGSPHFPSLSFPSGGGRGRVGVRVEVSAWGLPRKHLCGGETLLQPQPHGQLRWSLLWPTRLTLTPDPRSPLSCRPSSPRGRRRAA